MENITVGKNKRRDLFAQMAKAGEDLMRDGYLSISHIQRYVECGYTYATKIMDYLVNRGKLYQPVRVYFSRSVFHRVVENKTYHHRINATSPRYSNPQKALKPNSVLQPAQVR